MVKNVHGNGALVARLDNSHVLRFLRHLHLLLPWRIWWAMRGRRVGNDSKPMENTTTLRKPWTKRYCPSQARLPAKRKTPQSKPDSLDPKSNQSISILQRAPHGIIAKCWRQISPRGHQNRMEKGVVSSDIL